MSPPLAPWLFELIACPVCAGPLAPAGDRLSCARCPRTFPVQDGIPLLFVPNEGSDDRRDVTEIVRGFYEENPFPNYDGIDSVATLMAKAREGLYARLLDEQIPSGARVLDLGCGTGQLANFLSLASRTVVGSDLCLHSLRLGSSFAASQSLRRVSFLQTNLFRPALARESFHLVACNGVLHHTSDPEGGFRSLLRLVKPGGFVVIGLYNTYGRLMLDARRVIFRTTGGRFAWLDPYLRKGRGGGKLGAAKTRAWWMDQYHHPHESKHTIGEVLRWFDAAGVDFVSGLPPYEPSEAFDESFRLFAPHARGSRMDHARVQARLIRTGNREGGFFITIGRKRAA